MKFDKQKIIDFAPLLGLLILVVLYVIAMQGDISPYNIKILINQVVITAIVATGAIFIFSIGAFDISLGASTAVSAMTGALVLNATGSVPLMFLTCLVVGMGIGLFNSTLAAIFNLPAFVTTIAMLSILGSVVELLLAGNSQLAVDAALVKPFDSVIVKVVLTLVYFAICAFLQHFTKLGRSNMFLGDSPICAKQSGLSPKKLTIIVFVLAGIGVGIGAFLTIVRAPVLGKTTAASIGMDVLMAIVFGGMPLSGGSRTKITAAIVGAISIALLNQILPVFGLDTGMAQTVKAVLFLGVVFVASMGYREKMLPR
ncbi:MULTISPECIES: hypothetical protein [unclassified Breznakia]|uniref:ABC transporter permease n=1 Tax=unclassified Breznakia TaxID=2623764 RepID=UPI0024762C7B|nr:MULTISPECIES: hypothetical protein [unclassified Breznakia]MDH6366786.1 ribose transport system permease protein [Breznakia sp. PH1-1]MDH6403827.1 ribose transport system permease protein [Breznakia sp. PF1-11]MDH6411536.1 ribose transport system permease protein [Breznakia sp. PFB1-11]MDH6413900.1 ribose transport system permease protein [Breznakia sp. PFB1-14]MDH6416329.1 ribose transport system permease protein [Breznakia sp. PFB1-4]